MVYLLEGWRMSRLQKFLVGGGIAATLAAAFWLSAAAGQAQSPPVYWVDGARPTPIPGLRVEGEGCVPYSANRPDISICDEGVPDGWKPPPKPYFDEAICDAAQKWLAEQRAVLEAAGESATEIESEWPPEDASTCQVNETTNGATWIVTFLNARDSTDGIQVPYDPNGKVEWAAH